jgi:hypothetical protein
MAATAMAKPTSVAANFMMAVSVDVVLDWMMTMRAAWQIEGYGRLYVTSTLHFLVEKTLVVGSVPRAQECSV